MARGARFALAASNPPPPRGRSRRRRVRWWTCAPAIEGGKSCKKNPRHSAPTSSALFLPFSLSRSFSPLPTLRRPRFRSTPAGNRRRLYLSAGHVAPPPPPVLLVLPLSPPPCPLVLLRPSSSRSFILARLKGTYVCMASCTPLLCGILGASIERGDLSRAVRGTRPVRVYACERARAQVHTHVRMVHMTYWRRALVNLINPTDTSGTNVDGQYALSYFPR